MRTTFIVVSHPCLGLFSHIIQSPEDVCIQDSSEITSVKAFYNAVLCRMAGLDIDNIYIVTFSNSLMTRSAGMDIEISSEEYREMRQRYHDEIYALKSQAEILKTPNRGAVEPKLKYSMSLIDNIDKFFKYAPAEAKIRALSSIFSGKLEFDGKNFRTDNLNGVLV